MGKALFVKAPHRLDKQKKKKKWKILVDEVSGVLIHDVVKRIKTKFGGANLRVI